MTSGSLLTRLKRKAWSATFGEASWICRTGDFRTKEQYGLIDRPNYAYGMLRAADIARYFGHKSTTVIEFGVASGDGLLNMVALAELIEAETGITFRVIGFDTGAGLPTIIGYKDHPEIWSTGDFAMEDRAALTQKLNGSASIIWGDIGQTIDAFTNSLDPTSPIGFISIDVDIYSGSKSALRCLSGGPSSYLPAVSMYFDDVSFFFANRWCGELAAVLEFNEASSCRKIDIDRSLPGHRNAKAASWYQNMHVCHILDHPARQQTSNRERLTIDEHFTFMKERHLF